MLNQGKILGKNIDSLSFKTTKQIPVYNAQKYSRNWSLKLTTECNGISFQFTTIRIHDFLVLGVSHKYKTDIIVAHYSLWTYHETNSN